MAVSAKRRSAALELYALESRLAAARARAASAQAGLTAVRGERATLALQLRIARRGAAAAQLRLAKRLRLLYEEGDVDPIEVVFGARSLDDALTALDNIGAAAALDRRLIAQLRTARARFEAVDRTLHERETALVRIRADAAATAESLVAARADRLAYVSGLLRDQRATRAQLATLERQARRAERRAARVARRRASVTETRAPTADTSTPARSAGPTAPAPREPAPPAAPAPGAPPDGPRTLTVVATGYSMAGHTATGLPTGWGVAAVDPSVIPLGTRFTVPGYGEAVAADVGSGIRGAEVDLWFPTVDAALAWGRRTVTIVLH